MPPAPKFCNVSREIWEFEICRQSNPEETPRSDRDIWITTEVAINLESKVENVGIQGSVDSVFVYNTALTINELSYLQKFAQEIIPPTASTGGYAVSTKEPFYLKTMPITTQSLARSSTQTIEEVYCFLTIKR